MGEYDHAYRLYGCISTDDPLTDRGEMEINFIEEFQEKIAEPLGKLMDFEAYGKRIRGRYGDLYDENWDKTKKLILDGKIYRLFSGYKDFEFERKQFIELNEGKIKNWLPTEIMVLCFHSKEDERADLPKSIIEFSIVRWIYGERVPQYAADAYIDFIKEITDNVKSVRGHILLDFVGAPYYCVTAHERYTSFIYDTSIEKCDKYFRGYQWGNVLSQKHIEILGGKEKVEREAPVYRILPLNDGSMFLQLTKDINEVTDDDLRRLKKYFKPILYMPNDPKLINREALEEMRVIED